MSLIRLSYNFTGTNIKPVASALKLSRELQEEHDLVRGRDYSWHFSSADRELHILFHSVHAEQISTLVAMKYMGRNLDEI